MDLEERAMLRLLPPHAGKSVLDLGCGSGRYSDLLQPGKPRLVVGLDVSSAMLLRSRRSRASLVLGDGRTLPFPSRSFDLVVAGLVVGHVPELTSLLREVARVTRPKGEVVYSDLHPDGALAGWTRTFRAPDGSEHAAPHHVHSLADHERECRAAGFNVEAMIEPEVDFPHPWQGRPAALVVRARRSG
jgi:ubiquinone/menaquinone biosynthesis C-methylase UbiE